MSQWKAYEDLATRIYRSLAPHARITHDDHIAGLDSGINRQIDTSIRTSVAGHELLIVLQAKDLASPADVNVVGEFATVVRDVRASKGVLICSSGFTSSAKTLAKSHSIDLCTIHDASSDVWPLGITIPLLWVEFSCTFMLDMSLKPDAPNPTAITYSKDINRWRFSRNNGRTLLNPFKEFAQRLNDGLISRALGKTNTFSWDTQDAKFGFEPDYWCPVDHLSLHYKLTRKAWLGAFTLKECIGLMNETTDTLTAKLTLHKKDIPLARDPCWPEVPDPDSIERNSPNLLVIELPHIDIEHCDAHVEPFSIKRAEA